MKKLFLSTRRSILCGAILTLPVMAALSPAGLANPPSWWATRGVFALDPLTQLPLPADDYSVATQGQLKHFARSAYAEVHDRLPVPYSHSLRHMDSWLANSQTAPNADGYASVNLGQLKIIVQPFYDHLIARGLASAYPWSGTADDYALANLGQLKSVFSFDFDLGDNDSDGLPNYWETAYGFDPDQPGEQSGDPDNDGLTNLQEVGYKTSPLEDDTDGDGGPDGWEVQYGLDPKVRQTTDPDNDWLGLGGEYHAGTNPIVADTDGDGIKDGAEYTYMGLDPLNPQDAGWDPDRDKVTNLQEYNMAPPSPIYQFKHWPAYQPQVVSLLDVVAISKSSGSPKLLVKTATDYTVKDANTMSDLSTFARPSAGNALGVNAQGVVYGHYWDSLTGISWSGVWQSGVFTPVPGTYDGTYVWDINDAGIAIVNIWSGSTEYYAKWDINTGVVTPLSLATDLFPTTINNAGEIAGLTADGNIFILRTSGSPVVATLPAPASKVYLSENGTISASATIVQPGKLDQYRVCWFDSTNTLRKTFGNSGEYAFSPYTYGQIFLAQPVQGETVPQWSYTMRGIHWRPALSLSNLPDTENYDTVVRSHFYSESNVFVGTLMKFRRDESVPEFSPQTVIFRAPPPDNDNDGMPNDWEQLHGLNPNSAADAAQDRDSDGATNLQEYINGTTP